MILCLCQGVSDRVVRLAVMNGAHSVEAVAARCGAGRDCGACRHAIRDLVEDVRDELSMRELRLADDLDAGDAVPLRCSRDHSSCSCPTSSEVAAGA